MGGPAPATPGQPSKAAAVDKPAADAQAPAGHIIAAQKEGQALVSDVVGAKTVTPSGKTLGKLDDLILGDDGQVQGAVLSVGGFLGIGDKQVAVPWSAIQQRGPDQPLVVAMTKDQLEAAPEFMTLADQNAQRQAALSQPAGAVPAPATGAQ
jgi:sporulation protein YlmC with PRC-barrel domain